MLVCVSTKLLNNRRLKLWKDSDSSCSSGHLPPGRSKSPTSPLFTNSYVACLYATCYRGHILSTVYNCTKISKQNLHSKRILYHFAQNFLMTFFSHLHIKFYFIQPKLQPLNFPFSTAIFILQLQKIGTTAR